MKYYIPMRKTYGILDESVDMLTGNDIIEHFE
jgi:hypothetical protein